jgi:hypothetical protein
VNEYFYGVFDQSISVSLQRSWKIQFCSFSLGVKFSCLSFLFSSTIIMKKFLLTALIVLVALGFARSTMAATTPSLGLAATYGVLAGTYTNPAVTTTINGDVGYTIAPANVPLG